MGHTNLQTIQKVKTNCIGHNQCFSNCLWSTYNKVKTVLSTLNIAMRYGQKVLSQFYFIKTAILILISFETTVPYTHTCLIDDICGHQLFARTRAYMTSYVISLCLFELLCCAVCNCLYQFLLVQNAPLFFYVTALDGHLWPFCLSFAASRSVSMQCSK